MLELLIKTPGFKYMATQFNAENLHITSDQIGTEGKKLVGDSYSSGTML